MGFYIAHARLGPGSIHHCMRTIGTAEMALAALMYRAKTRFAFGSLLEEKDTVRRAIAEARISIAQCRQLCYLAACMADDKGFKAARKYIAMIKVVAPRMALEIVDEAIQVHGGKIEHSENLSKSIIRSSDYSHITNIFFFQHRPRNFAIL